MDNELLQKKFAHSLDQKLIDEISLKLTAHTISDYGDLIFLSGNNGLSIYDKVKKDTGYGDTNYDHTAHEKNVKKALGPYKRDWIKK